MRISEERNFVSPGNFYQAGKVKMDEQFPMLQDFEIGNDSVKSAVPNLPTSDVAKKLSI